MPAESLMVAGVPRGAGSGERGERADAGERVIEVLLPGPAGGHPQCPLPGGAGQPPGDLEQPALAGGGGPGAVVEQLSNVVDSAMKNDQAATLSFVVVSSSVTLIPSLNFAPSSTSLTSSWPLNRRQRSWAASKSL